MENIIILLDLAIILLTTKVLGVFMRKLGLPQVVGALIAGILIGPAIPALFGSTFSLVSSNSSSILKIFAEIGVVMLMFTAGLETDLKELKATGAKASFVALLGVALPLVLGFLVALPFKSKFGFSPNEILTCVFFGVVLTATSVGITVETLREMGKLKGKVGTIILSAAIIDDVVGIIILSFVSGLASGKTNIGDVVLNTVLFFVVAIAVGICLNYIFKLMTKKYPKNRRVPIFALVVCLFFSFCAMEFFDIAEITGAYLAGIMLSTIKSSEYIDKKIDISSYMIFTPIFFANIGIGISFEGITLSMLLFSLLFVVAGIVGKVIGCGAAAKVCKFSFKDSSKIGFGMIARGEVALIVAGVGVESGLITNVYFTPIVLLILITSFLAPIMLKIMFKKDNNRFGGNNFIANVPSQAEDKITKDDWAIDHEQYDVSELKYQKSDTIIE